MINSIFKCSATLALEAPTSSPILFRGNLCDNIIKSKQFGFDAVEIHIRKPDEVDAEEIKKSCSKNNIAVSTLGTGMSYTIDGLSLTSLDLTVKTAAIDRIKEYVDLAEKLDCGVIIGSMKGKINPDFHDKHLLEYKDSISKIAGYAFEKNVPIYIEAINRYEINFHNTLKEQAEFLLCYNNSTTKMMIDTFHMNIEEPDLEESIKKYGKLIGHAHFADSNRLYPGAGHIDFLNIMNSLLEIQYSGYVAFEYLPYPDPDTAAKYGLEYLRQKEIEVNELCFKSEPGSKK